MLILGAAVYITHISKENDHRARNNCGRVARYPGVATRLILVSVANVASSPDWQQSGKRLVDILITGSRPTR
jgi:hypothetical protein